MTQSTTRGMAMATAVAALLTSVGCGSDDNPEPTARADQAVRCQGINECKGLSECAGPMGENSCQGLNECKGMGWVTVASETECTDKGGTIITG